MQVILTDPVKWGVSELYKALNDISPGDWWLPVKEDEFVNKPVQDNVPFTFAFKDGYAIYSNSRQVSGCFTGSINNDEQLRSMHNLVAERLSGFVLASLLYTYFNMRTQDVDISSIRGVLKDVEGDFFCVLSTKHSTFIINTGFVYIRKFSFDKTGSKYDMHNPQGLFIHNNGVQDSSVSKYIGQLPATEIEVQPYSVTQYSHEHKTLHTYTWCNLPFRMAPMMNKRVAVVVIDQPPAIIHTWNPAMFITQSMWHATHFNLPLEQCKFSNFYYQKELLLGAVHAVTLSLTHGCDCLCLPYELPNAVIDSLLTLARARRGGRHFYIYSYRSDSVFQAVP